MWVHVIAARSHRVRGVSVECKFKDVWKKERKWFDYINTSSKLCWIVLLQILNPLVQQCKSCSAALNGVLQLSHSHIRGAFPSLLTFLLHVICQQPSPPTVPSPSSLDGPFVSVCEGEGYFICTRAVCGHSTRGRILLKMSTQLLELFSSPPLSLSVLFVSGWWYRKFCRS